MTAWRFHPDPLQWRLTQRWDDRDAAVKAANHARQLLPTRLLVLPESVILAEILMDPTWRRRIGLAELFYEQRPFYLHIARRLGLRGWARACTPTTTHYVTGSTSTKPNTETPTDSFTEARQGSDEPCRAR